MIVSSQTVCQEYRYLEANDPSGEFKLFLARQRGHEHHIDHYQDRFIIRTNSAAKNFRLMETPVESPGREHWQELIAHRDEVFLGDFELFRDYLVVEERARGLTQIRVLPWVGVGHYLQFDEPAYRANVGANPEFDRATLRSEYTSMRPRLPISAYDS